MVSSYKETEEQHYDYKAQNSKNQRFSYSDYVLKSSQEFYYKLISEKLSENSGLKILDYGCGGGDKHFQFANSENHIIGIDISSKSIKIANQKAKERTLNAEYLVMDCEKMEFADNTFDLVLDFGTFSSLNIEVAVKELCRVMKNDGMIICIETYGHNPFMKIKRGISVLTGRRTRWAAKHIMKKKSWSNVSAHFESCKIYYSHFLVLFLPFLLKIMSESYREKFLLKFEKIDSAILNFKFLQFLAFKTVVVLNNPKK